jgi:hypothetical protein
MRFFAGQDMNGRPDMENWKGHQEEGAAQYKVWWEPFDRNQGQEFPVTSMAPAMTSSRSSWMRFDRLVEGYTVMWWEEH